MTKSRRVFLGIASIVLFMIGLSIFFETVGPQLKWTHTLAAERMSKIVFDLDSRGAFAPHFDRDAQSRYAFESFEPLRKELAEAYSSTVVHGLLVLPISFGLLLMAIVPSNRPAGGVEVSSSTPPRS